MPSLLLFQETMQRLPQHNTPDHADASLGDTTLEKKKKKELLTQPAASDAHLKVRSSTSAFQAAGKIRWLSGFPLPIYLALLIFSDHKDGHNASA